MATSRAMIVLSLIVAASAAGPAKTTSSLATQGEEIKAERQVRSSSDTTVAMAVEPAGEVTRVQVREAAPAQIREATPSKVQLDAKPVAATVSMAVEPDGEVKKVQQSEPVAAKVQLNSEPTAAKVQLNSEPTAAKVQLNSEPAAAKVQLDAKPVAAKVQLTSEPTAAKVQFSEPEQAKAAHTKSAGAKKQQQVLAAAPEDQSQGEAGQETKTESDKSMKSTFFFFASIVLIVILASMIVARIYSGYHAHKEEVSNSETASLKGKTASASAAALQQHLNDSSSTSDSGEKIAMLFDRVRRSLEDLSNEKVESEQADVAGQGQTTKPAGTNTL